MVQADLLSADRARLLTDEVKADAQSLWGKLVDLYEGRAHIALGYSSWHAYFTAEFGLGRDTAYKALDAGRVSRVLADSTNGRTELRIERHARELSPLLSEPEALCEAWEEAVEETGGRPTAVAVREAVQRRRKPPSKRDEINANAAKRKVYSALAGIAGYCSGLESLHQDWALSVAEDEDRKAWERSAKEAIAVLTDFRRTIREEA